MARGRSGGKSGGGSRGGGRTGGGAKSRGGGKSSGSRASTVTVGGYTRSNGTRVAGYTRASPPSARTKSVTSSPSRTSKASPSSTSRSTSSSTSSTAFRNAPRKELNSGFKKHGSQAKGTEGSHQLSFRVAKAAKANSPGRPVEAGKKALATSMNHSSNVRMKNKETNRILDERRDRRIEEALRTKAPLTEKTTAKRAVQAHKAAMKSSNPSMKHIGNVVGELTIANGQVGRNVKVKNYSQVSEVEALTAAMHSLGIDSQKQQLG